MITVDGFETGGIAIVGGTEVPRIVLGIGLTGLPFDLVCPGFAGFDGDFVARLVAAAAFALRDDPALPTLQFDHVGQVDIRSVDQSWLELAWPESAAFHKEAARQLFPLEPSMQTIDLPDMSRPWKLEAGDSWLALSSGSGTGAEGITVVTNLEAMRGEPATEVARWEDGEFQFLAVDQAAPDHFDAWVTPIGVLVDHDRSLRPLVDTPPGRSWWRADGQSPWQHWRGWE